MIVDPEIIVLPQIVIDRPCVMGSATCCPLHWLWLLQQWLAALKRKKCSTVSEIQIGLWTLRRCPVCELYRFQTLWLLYTIHKNIFISGSKVVCQLSENQILERLVFRLLLYLFITIKTIFTISSYGKGKTMCTVKFKNRSFKLFCPKIAIK